ncbi:preprotein translocase subunit SecA [Bacillota bacterium]
MSFLEKIFGDLNTKELKKIDKIVDKIEELDSVMAAKTDEELKGMTEQFRERLSAGETIDDLLPEAFAVVREAAWRVLNMKHFRVQLVGGVVLHQGRISEMKTGEGKTLVATLPAYLNALEGKGIHVVTVNDYLAKRDMEWMGRIYTYLGMTVGCVIHAVTGPERKDAYMADITYGTNNEFGFDYLRDNMVTYKEDMMQRELNFAIVDEVDSILVDEARTPLIISGQGEKSTDLYRIADKFVSGFHEGFEFTMDEKDRTVSLTEQGVTKCEKYFKVDNFSDPENMEINHHVIQALKAHNLMKRDVDYILKDGEIVIVDEFTGRLMFGRRYSEGLHQAIEAKEGLFVRQESKTLATITLQNYFRMYGKLAGMTGTAKTEEEEFREIYNMDVVEIPTNKPITRIDMEDSIYSTERGKFTAIANQIAECNEKGQPVLVGTISIERSEIISALLKRRGIKHNVLNAKQHEREAEIVADAGKLGAVTIATNMAGRGTDIILGGSGCTSEDRDKVVELGGLRILGTERHESRRIDNQLRGRSGRQGDPGKTQFFISLEDDLMRRFGGDRIQGLVGKLGMGEDVPLEAGMLTKSIENAQKRVEGRNFAIRKYVLQYDDVMNKQREIIYGERRRVLFGEDLKEHILSMAEEIAGEQVDFCTSGSKFAEEWNLQELAASLKKTFGAFPKFDYAEDELHDLRKEGLHEDTMEKIRQIYDAKEQEVEADRMRDLERMILLRVVDNKWMDHIDAMDQLRHGIGLRALGQQDPASAYANEGFEMFDLMIKSIKDDTVRFCFNVTIQTQTQRKQVIDLGIAKKDEFDEGADLGDEDDRGRELPSAVKVPSRSQTGKQETVRKQASVGRNDPCPCGSGKKYKKCCGANMEE